MRLAVEHGLPGDWPVWVEHVRQLPEANRAPLRQLPHMAQVVTATELDLPGQPTPGPGQRVASWCTAHRLT
ncbi:hypothetical protein ULG90_06345 [Halopseudomonas pachastrellae]|nr:hypothetical protein ULG90_06345 [Halopseudomonas pachastrellae]